MNDIKYYEEKAKKVLSENGFDIVSIEVEDIYQVRLYSFKVQITMDKKYWLSFYFDTHNEDQFDTRLSKALKKVKKKMER